LYLYKASFYIWNVVLYVVIEKALAIGGYLNTRGVLSFYVATGDLKAGSIFNSW